MADVDRILIVGGGIAGLFPSDRPAPAGLHSRAH
jgi:succinate dehydrogenase/fumarate reductase flavoprotein subunit